MITASPAINAPILAIDLAKCREININISLNALLYPCTFAVGA
jgi:hypothetical protein